MVEGKFVIADLYKKNTLSQLDSVFKISEDIIDNLDDYALKELCEGYSWDIDKLFLDIIEESSKLLNTGGSIKTSSFSYLTSITNSLDQYLTDLSLAYFVSNKLLDFNIESYHLEWMNLIQIYRRLCILAARGHSKSFCFSFAYPLWMMWRYDGKSKIGKEGLIITAEDSLVKHFLEMIATQIEENPLIRERLFPGKTAVGWGKERLITKNKFVLEGKSANSNLRGRHDTAFVICDDFLDESNFFNPDVRKKTIEFFHSVVANIPIYKSTSIGVVGCVKGDTLVLEKDKGFTQIVNLAPEGINLYEKGIYDSNDKILSSYNDFKTSSKFFVNGEVPTKRITLDNGLSIEGSLIHPLWKFNEDGKQDWCKLPDLKVGDIVEIKGEEEAEDWGTPQRIIVPEGVNGSYKINLPEFINEDIAYFLGLFISEGNFHKDTSQVQITNFEVDLSFMDKYGVHFESWDNGRRWYCSRKIFKEWMFTLFGRVCKSNQKHIPDCILRGPKSCLTACIQGMFDGDGTCGNLAYSSASEKLIDQLQSVLLMGYGINSKKTLQTKEKINESNILGNREARANFNNYGLNFPEMEGLKFVNRIGFRFKRKQDKTLQALENCKDSISLPTPVSLLRKIKELGVKNKVKYTRVSVQVLNRNGYLTIYRLKDIYEYYSQYFSCSELDSLREYFQKRWRKIETITDSVAYTYDFVIPEKNSFIGNGFNNHNTPMSSDDLYANLKTSKGWRCFEYPAIYPDGHLLSPERFDLQGLLDKRTSQGSIVFAREILVKPISSESTLFPMNLLRIALVDTVPMVSNKYSIPFKLKKIGIGLDLSISASVDADYFVALVIGLDEQNRYWVLNIVREHNITYNQQLAIVKRLYENFVPDSILCENNQYQEAFCQILRDNNIPVISKPTGLDKYSFTVGIPALSVLFEQGRLKIPYEADPSTRNAAEMLISELYSMTFSSGKLAGSGSHDDLCSGLWKAIQSLNYVSADLMLDFISVH